MNFDPYCPAVHKDSPKAFAEFSKSCPAYHYEGRFDFFIVNDADYITGTLLKDNETWTAEYGSAPTAFPDEMKSPMMREDRSHLEIRQIVKLGFSPKELVRLQGVVERLTDELIDHMLALSEPEGDFFQLFAMPLPARLMCIMLGAPEADYAAYKRWADRYYFSLFNDPHFSKDAHVEDGRWVTKALFELVAQRRAQLKEKGLKPDISLVGTELPNDFLSRFMCSKIGGDYVSDETILVLMLAIIVGGNETTMNLIGNLLWRLLQVPERWEQIKKEPPLIEAAIEESLRLDPPVLTMFRTARHDVEIDGVNIPKGAKVMYNVPAVNRDPTIFDNPDEFRLDRPRKTMMSHASFAGGVHLCLGAGLARMEVKTAFTKLIARLPKLRLAGEPELADGFNVWGKKYLPIGWN